MADRLMEKEAAPDYAFGDPFNMRVAPGREMMMGANYRPLSESFHDCYLHYTEQCGKKRPIQGYNGVDYEGTEMVEFAYIWIPNEQVSSLRRGLEKALQRRGGVELKIRQPRVKGNQGRETEGKKPEAAGKAFEGKEVQGEDSQEKEPKEPKGKDAKDFDETKANETTHMKMQLTVGSKDGVPNEFRLRCPEVDEDDVPTPMAVDVMCALKRDVRCDLDVEIRVTRIIEDGGPWKDSLRPETCTLKGLTADDIEQIKMLLAGPLDNKQIKSASAARAPLSGEATLPPHLKQHSSQVLNTPPQQVPVPPNAWASPSSSIEVMPRAEGESAAAGGAPGGTRAPAPLAAVTETAEARRATRSVRGAESQQRHVCSPMVGTGTPPVEEAPRPNSSVPPPSPLADVSAPTVEEEAPAKHEISPPGPAPIPTVVKREREVRAVQYRAVQYSAPFETALFYDSGKTVPAAYSVKCTGTCSK